MSVQSSWESFRNDQAGKQWQQLYSGGGFQGK